MEFVQISRHIYKLTYKTVMGIPVISIYQADLLCVDKYLVDRDRLKVDPNVSYDAIKNMLESNLEIKKEWAELRLRSG